MYNAYYKITFIKWLIKSNIFRDNFSNFPLFLVVSFRALHEGPADRYEGYTWKQTFM